MIIAHLGNVVTASASVDIRSDTRAIDVTNMIEANPFSFIQTENIGLEDITISRKWNSLGGAFISKMVVHWNFFLSRPSKTFFLSTNFLSYVNGYDSACSKYCFAFFSFPNSIYDWFDETEYQELTVILNGNRSALAGSDLSGTDRDILCSMGSTQSFQTDQFNITRSLEDPTADSNSDGEVSYMEAFLKEDQNLQFDTQDPESFS